jgi:uncharacterized protein involved in type VI secretion and phage assembly
VPETASSVSVVINGSSLAADKEARLYSAEVDEQLNQPARCTLMFQDADSKIISETGVTVGATLEIRATSTQTGPSGTLIFDGEVTAFEYEKDSTGAHTIVRAYEKTHRLQQGRRAQAYLNMTYGDVVGEVVQRNALVSGTIEQGPLLLSIIQAAESDWDFVMRLAGELGYVAGLVDGKFNFGPPPSLADAANAVKLVMDVDIIRLRASVSATEQVSSVEVRSWDPSQKQALVATHDVSNAYASGNSVQSGLAGAFGSPPTLRLTRVPLPHQSLADNMAQGLATQLGGSRAEIDAIVFGDPELQAGHPIKISNVGSPFDGSYLLTGVQHRWEGPSYTTEIRVDGASRRSLWGLTGSSSPFTGPSFAGVVPAIVTNVKDPENQGRVKLKFPWLDDSLESDWARVSLMGAGSSRGSTWLPEVNDEVLAAFEHGDIRRVYVLGGLNNGQDSFPVGAATVIDSGEGKIVERALVSRKGHTVALFDGDNSSKMQLATAGGITVTLDDTNKKIAVSSTGDISIEGTGSVSIKGTDVSIEATSGAVTLKGQTGVNVNSDAGNVKLNGSQVNVSGTGPVAIKGAVVQLN